MLFIIAIKGKYYVEEDSGYIETNEYLSEAYMTEDEKEAIRIADKFNGKILYI